MRAEPWRRKRTEYACFLSQQNKRPPAYSVQTNNRLGKESPEEPDGERRIMLAQLCIIAVEPLPQELCGVDRITRKPQLVVCSTNELAKHR
jgi:hypothetical protein